MQPGQLIASASPGQIWRHALADFAARQGLPIDRLLRGEPFSCDGQTFLWRYDEKVDPNGLLLMLDLGPVPADTEHAVNLRMLTHNASQPALAVGYYGLLAGTANGVYCVRLDVRRSAQPALLIEAVVTSMAASFNQMHSRLTEAFKALPGTEAEASGMPGAGH